MTRYLVQPRDRIFVRGYGILSFAKYVDNDIGKDSSGKFCQKLLDQSNNLQQMRLKLIQKISIQKTAEETSDLIDNKIVDAVGKS